MTPHDAEVEAILGGMRGQRRGAEIIFQCVAHEDDKPSASWNRKKGAWHCMGCGAGGTTLDLAARLGIRIETTHDRAERDRIVASYVYRHPDGSIAYRKVRYEPKRFGFQRWENEQWKDRIPGVQHILYRLDQLPGRAGEWLFICEGEKDADAVGRLGLAATTSPGGAQGRSATGVKGKQKWETSYTPYFNGYRVALLQDNDEAGEDFCAFVAQQLTGVAQAVKVLLLPGLPKKGDVSDWILQGGTGEELVRLAEAAPVWEPVAAIAPGGFALSDAGNAELFAHLYGDKVRWDHRTNTWLIWDKHRWIPDQDGQVVRWAIAAARERAKTAIDMEPAVAKMVFGWSKSSENARGIEGMHKVAKATFPISDGGGGWDANPMLLGCENGVLNLTDGKLRPGKPEDRITMSTGLDYDPAATCDDWEQFVLGWFEGDTEMVAYMQRVAGYALTGSTREEIFFLAYGSGGNGKSKFFLGLKLISGDYYTNIASDTIKRKPGGVENHPAELAAVAGKRIVTCSEMPVGATLNDDRVKSLVGGDTQTARFMRGNPFTFQPVAKLFLMTNDLPKIDDLSEGFWRRLHMNGFLHTFEGAERDLLVEEKIKAEAQGILAWAVRGCIDWHKRGLQPPAKVLLGTLNYRNASDPLADFISECCITEATVRCSQAEFYKAYVAWAATQGMQQREVLTSTKVGILTAKRFQKERGTHGTRLLLGVRIRYDDEVAGPKADGFFSGGTAGGPNLPPSDSKGGQVAGWPLVITHTLSPIEANGENAKNLPPATNTDIHYNLEGSVVDDPERELEEWEME